MESFEIAGVECAPGGFTRARITAGYFDDGAAIEIPLLVLHGRSPGPVLWLGSTIHGIEIVGAEIIRRVIREEVDPDTLSGTIVGAPIQNPVSFLDQTYLTRRDGLNINRFFPGNPSGSLSERIAHALYSEGVSRADMVVDIHANTAPAVAFTILRTGDEPVFERARRMAEAYGMTILESAAKKPDPAARVLSGLLMDAAIQDGKPAITLEYEAFTLDRRWVEAGLTGTLNLMKSFHMLPGTPEEVEGVSPLPEPLTASVVLRPSYGGLLHPLVPPGTHVDTGDPVARVIDAFGEERETLRSTVDGYVLCYPRFLGSQTVATGDEAVYIAPIKRA
jgi:uncharacterized protein